MSKKTKHDFSTGMLQLRHEYVKRLSSQLSEFRRYAALLDQGFLPARDAQDLYRLSHNLTGSGLTFGFGQISDAAKQLNKALGDYMDVDFADPQKQAQRRQFVNEKLQEFEQICRTAISATEVHVEESAGTDTSRRVGFFVKKKDDVAPLADAMRDLGYEAVYAHSREGLQNLVNQQAAPFWIAYSGLTSRETFKMQDLKMILGNVPFYLVTSRDTFDTRLAALRLGATGFSLMGPDMHGFAYLLDARANGIVPSKAPHILIVDEDDMLASFFSHALTAANMLSTRAHSAKEAYELMQAQSYDLVIMNVEMANCTGLELAQIMRQMSPAQTMPILFITARDQPAGYDQASLLKKPFLPEDLVKKVTTLLQ